MVAQVPTEDTGPPPREPRRCPSEGSRACRSLPASHRCAWCAAQSSPQTAAQAGDAGIVPELVTKIRGGAGCRRRAAL